MKSLDECTQHCGEEVCCTCGAPTTERARRRFEEVFGYPWEDRNEPWPEESEKKSENQT